MSGQSTDYNWPCPPLPPVPLPDVLPSGISLAPQQQVNDPKVRLGVHKRGEALAAIGEMLMIMLYKELVVHARVDAFNGKESTIKQNIPCFTPYNLRVTLWVRQADLYSPVACPLRHCIEANCATED